MKVAVQGCCHGSLDAIYAALAAHERAHGYTADVLLVCGDFQAVRNARDLQCMAVPARYRELGGFWRYYTGEKRAGVLTVVVGGNHEASNYMWELYHGGWLAPNIYFLGHAGCVRVNGVRIAGASGIYKAHDFRQGHWETLPYDHGSMRSIYHIREYNIRRLSLLTSPDIMLSHDWPQGIEQHGDVAGLLRRKPFFRADVASGRLGSPPLMGLLRTLQPRWWFAAHLHVRFEATFVHEQQAAEVAVEVAAAAVASNPDEISLEEEEEGVEAPPGVRACTKFLALDKCLPRGGFLEVIEVAAPGAGGPDGPTLAYDGEWLAITRAFAPYFTRGRTQVGFPGEEAAREMVKRERVWVDGHVGDRRVEECQVFERTAPGPGSEGEAKMEQPPEYVNGQTLGICRMLEIGVP